MKSEEILQVIKERYSKAAQTAGAGEGSCCCPSAAPPSNEAGEQTWATGCGVGTAVAQKTASTPIFAATLRLALKQLLAVFEQEENPPSMSHRRPRPKRSPCSKKLSALWANPHWKWRKAKVLCKEWHS